MLTKNRIIFFVYFAQLGFLLGTKPLTYLMIAYLTAEFAAIILVFTYYKMRNEGNYITHLLNIPGGALFVFLFCIIAYYLGIAVEEIPAPPKGQEGDVNPLEPFYSNIIPISAWCSLSTNNLKSSGLPNRDVGAKYPVIW